MAVAQRSATTTVSGPTPLDTHTYDLSRYRVARVDPLHYPNRFAPLPLLLLHGEHDTWNPPTTTQQFAALVAPSYQDPHRFRSVLVPNAPHWPPTATIVEEAAAWLTKHLT